jgi:hypothetical protein
MPEKDKAPRQGDLLEALDSLTGLIAQREQRGAFTTVDDEGELDLEGFDFGPALDDPVPMLDDVVQTPEPILPSHQTLESLVETYLDRRLAELREQLKREIFIELRKRYPDL